MLRQIILAIAFSLLTYSPAIAQLSLNDCHISGEPVRCGTLRVPENRTTPAGRQMDLAIVVVPHSDRGESKEPLFILKGGPGERATADAEDTFQMFRSVRRDRDLVLLDQRGTGEPNRLQCDIAEHTFVVPRDPERCLRDLSDKADLRQYTTEHFVQDLEAARSALGYEQISLWAGSYGTRAAYVYAKRYPQRVRSLVLIAAAPLSMPVLDTFAEEGRIALDALIADCVTDRECAGPSTPGIGATTDLRTAPRGLLQRRRAIHVISGNGRPLVHASGIRTCVPRMAACGAAPGFSRDGACRQAGTPHLG